MDQAQSLRDIMNRKKESGIQVITVTSAKGGVGKSSVAINLSIALSQRGRKVLIVDSDFGLANVDVMLGVRSKFDLSSVIQGEKDIREVIERGSGGVRFISGGSGVEDLLNMNPQQLQKIVNNLMNLKDVVDTIIFDTGAGITELIIRLVCASHVTWLVTTPEPTAIMDAYAMVKILNKEATQPNIQLIINRAESEREARAAIDGFIRIAAKYTNIKISELGYIARDDHMISAVKQQEPILMSYPKSAASVNIGALADRFLESPAKEKSGLSGFFERLLKKNINGWV